MAGPAGGPTPSRTRRTAGLPSYAATRAPARCTGAGFMSQLSWPPSDRMPAPCRDADVGAGVSEYSPWAVADGKGAPLTIWTGRRRHEAAVSVPVSVRRRGGVLGRSVAEFDAGDLVPG
jgi:hypothetical protein